MLDGDPVLVNVTFNNNKADCGGAVEINGGGSFTMDGGAFTNNTATMYGCHGGAITLDGRPGTINNVTFSNNSAYLGGAISVFRYGNLKLSNSTFQGNQTNLPEGRGGAIAVEYGTLTAANCSFDSNTADEGGAITVEPGVANVSNSIFSGNSAGRIGGAVASSDGTVNLSTVTMTSNHAAAGGGIYMFNGSVSLTNSILWGDSGSEIIQTAGALSVSYSDVQQSSGVYSGTGNINADPLFVNAATGDLRLLPGSPVIDAGSNDALPVDTLDVNQNGNSTEILPIDLAGKPRRVNTLGASATGSGTQPIVDMGTYEFADLPDLQVSKTNSAGGSVAAGASFDWLVTVRNSGAAAAAFASGTVILRDELPTTVTYGTPLVEAASGLTGTINCSITDNVLSCTATGTVTLTNPAGAFTVRIPVTTSGWGILTNPRTGGICRVDPGNLLYEAYKNNNDCNSDSVGVAIPAMTGEIRTTANIAVTSAAIGSSVHGSVALSGPAGSSTPSGTATLNMYDNAACTGTLRTTETKTLTGGTADFTPLTAASFYYQVLYSGDAEHLAVAGSCTLFSAVQPGPLFTVNTIADTTLDNLCTDIHCTLREAITVSNGASGAATILFNVGDGQNLTLTSALPAVDQSGGTLTIDGEEHAVVISGANLYRIFTIQAGSTVTLRRLTISSGNTADGGAVYNAGALTIKESTLSGNHASSGGAIYNNGTLTLSGSTVSGNTAGDYAGAILNTGTVTATNSTISGNSSPHGGAFFSNGNVTLANSTVNANSTGEGYAAVHLWSTANLSYNNTIIANTSSGFDCNIQVGSLSGSNNLVKDGTCGATLTGDPKLGPLADNGGYTFTHALLTGSAAINAGNLTSCPATDQRGIIRPMGAGCDIGGYEYVDTAPPVVTSFNAPSRSIGPAISITAFTASDSGGISGYLVTTSATPPTAGAEGWAVTPPALFMVATVGSYTLYPWVKDGYGNVSSLYGSPVTVIVVSPILHTATGGLTSGYCQTWASACDAGYALQNATVGQELWVKKGTYTPVEPGGSRSATFLLNDGVLVYGGFAGTETNREERNPAANATILSGDLNGNDGPGFTNNSENSYHVVTANGGTLDGVTISGGNADYNDQACGGGVYIITGNPLLTNLTISNNAARNGGGICSSASTTLSGITFSGNYAYYEGGAVFAQGASVSLTNATFTGNIVTEAGQGSAIGIVAGASMTVTNSTVIGSETDPGTLIDSTASTMTIRNSIIWGAPSGWALSYSADAPVVTYSIVQDGYEGTGNSSADPLLGTLGSYGGSTQVYPLLVGSPAINAGNDAACPAFDQRGLARPQGAHCDMGAFEKEFYTVTFNSNGSSGSMTAQSANVATNLTTNSFTRAGFSFAGWNTVAGGSGTNYADGGSYAFAADVTLYAQWTLLPTYTVAYNGNSSDGGTTPTDVNSYLTGATVTVKTNTFTKTGYSFAGWYPAANGSGTVYGATFTMGSANTVLYAKWTALPTYAVTYNANGSTSGTAPGAQTKTQGIDLTLATNSGTLAKTGFTFAGWNTATDGTGTSYAVGATYSTDAALTLYAKWTTLPTVTGISPASGITAGGTSVTITGTNFTGATTVTIGGSAATGVSVDSATTITAVTSTGTAGAKNVVVTTPAGSGTGIGLFTYFADAQLSVTPSDYLFGVVTLGDCTASKAVPFTVTNNGSSARTLGTLAIAGVNSDQFTLSPDSCSGQTVAASGTCSATVTFCPTSIGSKGAMLNIPLAGVATPVLTALLHNNESTDEEARRRVPPVIYTLGSNFASMTKNVEYTLTWSLLGYDDSYQSLIAFFDCTGISDGSCGDSYGSKFAASAYLAPVSTEAGAWTYNGIVSDKFNYSYTLTAPATAKDIVVRFYSRSVADAASGKSGLSTLIPGNQSTTYYDQAGRRILIHIVD